MKYNIGDRVRIRKDLVVGDRYEGDAYIKEMDDIAKNNDYVLTIERFSYDNIEYVMAESNYEWFWTDAMIEGLELTDREKFEGWMKELGRLTGGSDIWKSLDGLTYLDPDEDEKEFEEALKTVADYLFDTKKRMTKTEIEAELGYEIEIVEE